MVLRSGQGAPSGGDRAAVGEEIELTLDERETAIPPLQSGPV